MLISLVLNFMQKQSLSGTKQCMCY